MAVHVGKRPCMAGRNWWVDDRQDPQKSPGGGPYLKDLYAQRRWYLAMAAYNRAGTVQHAVERTGYADFTRTIPRGASRGDPQLRSDHRGRHDHGQIRRSTDWRTSCRRSRFRRTGRRSIIQSITGWWRNAGHIGQHAAGTESTCCAATPKTRPSRSTCRPEDDIDLHH